MPGGDEYAHNLVQIAAFPVLTATAGTLFLAADPEAVRRISRDEQQRVHTFALLASLRVIGFGLSAALATSALALDVGANWIWNAMVMLIAGTNLTSAVFLWSLRYVDDIWSSGQGGVVAAQPPRYRDVLCQDWFMVFIGGTFVVALVIVGMDVVLPVHLLSLGLPRWSATVSYLVMCRACLVVSAAAYSAVYRSRANR